MLCRNCSALLDEATGHRRNAGIPAGGPLRGHLEFAKHFPGGLGGAQGALWNGKLAARSLGNGFAVRKTNRLHIYKGFWGKSARGAVNMQQLWPSSFTM